MKVFLTITLNNTRPIVIFKDEEEINKIMDKLNTDKFVEVAKGRWVNVDHITEFTLEYDD